MHRMYRHRIYRFGRLVIFPAAFVLLAGCATFNPANTPTLNLVRKHVVPESTGMQVATFPLWWPAATAAGLVDAALVHPVTVVDDAAIDAQRALWTGFDWKEEYVTGCVGLPWRAALTPPAFAGAYLGRVLFDIPDREASERAAQKVAEAVLIARNQIATGKASDALRTLAQTDLRPVWRDEKRADLMADYELTALEAAWRADRYPLMQATWQTGRILKSAKGAQLRDLIARIKREGDAMAQWQATTIEMATAESADAKMNILRETLRHPSAAYRMLALQWTASNLTGNDAMQMRDDLARVARIDSDPTNRAFAHSLLQDLTARSTPPAK